MPRGLLVRNRSDRIMVLVGEKLIEGAEMSSSFEKAMEDLKKEGITYGRGQDEKARVLEFSRKRDEQAESLARPYLNDLQREVVKALLDLGVPKEKRDGMDMWSFRGDGDSDHGSIAELYLIENGGFVDLKFIPQRMSNTTVPMKTVLRTVKQAEEYTYHGIPWSVQRENDAHANPNDYDVFGRSNTFVDQQSKIVHIISGYGPSCIEELGVFLARYIRHQMIR